MGIDWEKAEKLIRPVPSYEKLIARLQETMTYNFVRETYNQNMEEAKGYADRLLGSDPKQRYGEYLERIMKTLQRLSSLNVKNYLELIDLVKTREEVESFCSSTKLDLDEILRVLKYLLFCVLPTKMYLRELIDKENQKQLEYITTLREKKIRFTLDLLENGRTAEKRRKISEETGVPADFISELVDRADFTRMPYVSGNTVRHYFSAGCKSLEQLSKADLDQLTSAMTGYMDSLGMKLSRSFIELDSGITIAKVLPKIVEN